MCILELQKVKSENGTCQAKRSGLPALEAIAGPWPWDTYVCVCVRERLRCFKAKNKKLRSNKAGKGRHFWLFYWEICLQAN